MDSHYLQQQRFQLQKRIRRLNSCDSKIFHSALVQFWNYLHAQPLLAGILARQKAEAPDHADDLAALQNWRIPTFAHESEASAFVFRVIEHCAQQPLGEDLGPEIMMGRGFVRSGKTDELLDGFREHFLEPFYENLDESLDQQTAVLSLLIKYKRKVEWFERDIAHSLAADGERALARHLYAYLFDQGLDFHIEPQSASGEADLVSPDLVLDAKIFDGDASSRGTRYIKHGVNQLLTYTRDFNQRVGYLVIYRTCPEDLQFPFAGSDVLVPFVNFGGKILYLLVVDICSHERSASKRGGLRAHVMDTPDLISVLTEATAEQADASTEGGAPPING